jgi:integrase
MARKRLPSKLHLLSVREVQTAREGDHSDGGNLLLRVRKDGGATWVFRYTSPTGKRREMGLGATHRHNAATAGACLTAARELATKARNLLQEARDPIDERDRERDEAKRKEETRKVEQARERWTLARCARDYHARAVEPKRTPKHAAQWISSLENHVPKALWDRPIADVMPPELLAALAEVKPHERARNVRGQTVPETLQRIRQRLDAVFEDAIFRGRCTTNPAAGIKRKMREELPAKSAGQFAALPYRETPAFLQKVRASEGIAARCLEFALLTAARTGEAIAAEWDEFNLDEGIWTVPPARMKKGELHTVYLSPRALEIVKGQLGADPRYVFPSPLTAGKANSKPLSNMAMLTLLDRIGERKRTTVHGVCRATFSTWANETGAARPDVIEACLAHQEANLVRAAYNRAEFAQERRQLLQAWADYCGRNAASVTPIRAQRA